MRDLTPADLSWIETAPQQAHMTAVLAASPARVFDAFADADGWPRWFPLMTSARWIGEAGGVGAEREVALRGFGRFRERFLAWEPGRRFSFTVIASSSSMMSRFAEDYRLTPDGSGTRFDWTLGAQPAGVGRLAAAPMRLFMRRLLARSARNLDAMLRA